MVKIIFPSISLQIYRCFQNNDFILCHKINKYHNSYINMKSLVPKVIQLAINLTDSGTKKVIVKLSRPHGWQSQYW
jgi:hypothetical protein